MKTKSPLPVAHRPFWYASLAKCALPLSLGLLFAVGAQATTAPHENNHAAQSAQKPQPLQQVTGTVVDTEGEALAGVTIRVKGTALGTTTDAQGRFTLRAKQGAVLQVSYIGYERQEVTVSGTKLNLTLQPNDNSLNEAVVIGYGTVRKADLAGSVAVMDSKAFKDQPITRVSDALQGRVSGVQVVSSGIPGGSVKIRVRGTGSIHNSNEPLYVVDGVVRETGLDGINPDDIASMQVLKDASSTAIYGSRGANGVVLIQTKSGKAGQTLVTFDAAVGMSNATHMPKMMGTREYAELLTKYKFNGNAPDALKPFLDGTKPGIDWEDMMLQTGVTQDYKLSLSKGNDDTQFYVSTNYMKREGVVVGTEHERYSAKTNVHTKVYPWLELTTDIQASRVQGNGNGFFGMNISNPLVHMLSYSPTMDMYEPDGITCAHSSRQSAGRRDCPS